MSADKAFTDYESYCDCGKGDKEYKGLNCAHYLSRALIKAGFDELKNKPNFACCPKGCPIRAKELRGWFAEKWGECKDEPSDGINLVYQQKGNQGHVLMKKHPSGSSAEGQVDYTDKPGWNIQEYYHVTD